MLKTAKYILASLFLLAILFIVIAWSNALPGEYNDNSARRINLDKFIDDTEFERILSAMSCSCNHDTDHNLDMSND